MLPQKPLSLTKPRGISFHLLHQITLMYIGFLRPFPFFFFLIHVSLAKIFACLSFPSFSLPPQCTYSSTPNRQPLLAALFCSCPFFTVCLCSPLLCLANDLLLLLKSSLLSRLFSPQKDTPGRCQPLKAEVKRNLDNNVFNRISSLVKFGIQFN